MPQLRYGLDREKGDRTNFDRTARTDRRLTLSAYQREPH
jgi:hypothetical protein